MSSEEIETARRVSPTLRRRRSSSSRQAVLTRERLAHVASDKALKEQPTHLAQAEPFLDDSLTVEAEVGEDKGRWLGLILACATIGLGALIIATSLRV